ncbi:MAG: HigA family addiction module antidote protein [Bacteroidales bacterium]|nr:HigA family addiction module antidote protein [Bacteroidales bacterium]
MNNTGLFDIRSKDMIDSRNIKPFISMGPGQYIKDFLEDKGWSQEELAELIDMSPKQLSQIINDKVRITIETARLLGKAFETSAELWINLDTQYRLSIESDSKKENATERKLKIIKRMPASEILKKGWFKGNTSAEGYENLYRSIWSTDPDDNSVYEKPKHTYCARQKKDTSEYTDNYTLTWKKVAEIKSRNIVVPEYDKRKLLDIVSTYSRYTSMEDGITRIVSDLNEAGIKFFVLSHVSKTYLDGACFFQEDNPVIVYTGRFDRVDNFWFTLAHEIAHVLLHLDKKKCDAFLDDMVDHVDGDKREKEADAKAEEMLRVGEILRKAQPYLNYFSEVKLKEIAEELQIEESVILGVLQHKGHVDYRKLNKYKEKVLPLIPKELVMG